MTLHGALVEAERAVSALLAEAASAHYSPADGDAMSLLRRIDALAVTLQRARRFAAAPGADGSDAWWRGFSSLPHAVQLHIFSLLPVDERARATTVRRAWCATLTDASVWTQLDLSPESGLARRRATDEVLRGAAAKAAAAGGLLSLDVSSCSNETLTHGALLAVVTAHAATLRQLRRVFPPHECVVDSTVSGSHIHLDQLQALLRAAPLLQSADFTVVTGDRHAEALPLLQRSREYAHLQLHSLMIIGSPSSPADVSDVCAVLEAVACYEPPLPLLSLESMDLSSSEATEALERVCARVSGLEICECNLHPLLGRATLARAIFSSLATLTALHLSRNTGRNSPPLLDAATAALLVDSLRAQDSCMTSLSLASSELFEPPAVGLTLLAALTGHPHVRDINIEFNALRACFNNESAHEGDRALIGAALGALVAANTPALTNLNISSNSLGDAGLLPLFEALRVNTHLRTLRCESNIVRGAAAAALLASVRAGASGLRELRILAEDCMYEIRGGSYRPPAAAVQAEALVARRTKAA